GWKEAASKHAVRIGISPAFACPLVERTVDFAGVMPREKEVPRCKACGRKGKELEEGAMLKRCVGCRGAVYCSGECQKKDWTKHRFECKKGVEQS
ncbi:zinc finger MYND domain-containing protein, partial [Candidatus Bathyarchaeota archaeon]|nr:zinc finger MYND domain-containing protein [Candidatus Bathyarchaeota archaeon]